MALQDYIPNIFGVTDPGVEGLLGADQSKSLQSRSNIAGLLGAAAALSQGMSRGGPRRSALQNILGAASGGFQSSQGAYQQGLQTVGQQQQLAQQMRERERAEMTRQAVERVIQSPEVASNPALTAQLRVDPINTLKFINENMGLRRAMPPLPTQSSNFVQPEIDPASGLALPAIDPVIGKTTPFDEIDRLNQYRANVLADTSIPTKTRQEEAKLASDQIEVIRKNIAAEGLMDFDFNKARERISPQSLPAFDLIQQSVEQGIVDPKELPKMLQDLSKKPGDVESYLYAKTEGYKGNFEKWKKGPGRIAAGETIVNVGDKVLAGERAKSQSKAEDAAMSAQNAASDVAAIIDVLKPYRGGALQDFAGLIGAYFPGTKLEQLATARQAAEAIRAKLAPTLRVEGSGQTSDFEIKSFLSAIPSLFNTVEGRELMATYTQRLADRSAAAADIRARLTEENKFSLKNFREALRAEGLDRVFTDEDLVKLRGGGTPSKTGSTLPPEIKKKYNLKD